MREEAVQRLSLLQEEWDLTAPAAVELAILQGSHFPPVLAVAEQLARDRVIATAEGPNRFGRPRFPRRRDIARSVEGIRRVRCGPIADAVADAVPRDAHDGPMVQRQFRRIQKIAGRARVTGSRTVLMRPRPLRCCSQIQRASWQRGHISARATTTSGTQLSACGRPRTQRGTRTCPGRVR